MFNKQKTMWMILKITIWRCG